MSERKLKDGRREVRPDDKLIIVDGLVMLAEEHDYEPEPATPECKFKVGDWVTWQSGADDVAHDGVGVVTAIYKPGDTYDVEVVERESPEWNGTKWGFCVANILSIPRRPDSKPGKELTGRIVDSRKAGTRFVGVDDLWNTHSNGDWDYPDDADTTGFAWRRWEWREAKPVCKRVRVWEPGIKAEPGNVLVRPVNDDNGVQLNIVTDGGVLMASGRALFLSSNGLLRIGHMCDIGIPLDAEGRIKLIDK